MSLVHRGDIYRIKLPKGTGHAQYGKRFAVVVQSDAMLPRSVVLIAPTSTSARTASFRPEIVIDDTKTKVLVEQTGAVDTARLGKFADHVSAAELWGIDEALRTIFDLR